MRPIELSLQLASIAEAEAIAQLSRSLIEAGLGWSWTPARVRRAILDRETLVLIARAEHEIAGFAIMQFGDDQAHLSLLAVQARFQRRGVGHKLVAWLTESALVAGIRTISLELRAANHPARAFYRALGFRDVALVPRYYLGREAALRMARTIALRAVDRAE